MVRLNFKKSRRVELKSVTTNHGSKEEWVVYHTGDGTDGTCIPHQFHNRDIGIH